MKIEIDESDVWKDFHATYPDVERKYFELALIEERQNIFMKGYEARRMFVLGQAMKAHFYGARKVGRPSTKKITFHEYEDNFAMLIESAARILLRSEKLSYASLGREMGIMNGASTQRGESDRTKAMIKKIGMTLDQVRQGADQEIEQDSQCEHPNCEGHPFKRYQF